jgi:hypothetical protein
MNDDSVLPTELPVIERTDLALGNPLTPAEWAELSALLRQAVPAPATSEEVRPVEFANEDFRERIETAAAKHVARAEARNANPPTPQQLQDMTPELARAIREKAQDYRDTCGPLDVSLDDGERGTSAP